MLITFLSFRYARGGYFRAPTQSRNQLCRIATITKRFMHSSYSGIPIDLGLKSKSDSRFLIVNRKEAGTRLDKMLACRFPDYSRSYLESLVTKDFVLVNGAIPEKSTRLRANDSVEIIFPIIPETSVVAESIPLDILYEDSFLIIVNKPAGMVVHPGAGNQTGTFANALLHHSPQVVEKGSLRPGIVHRLDKETSGLLLAAKDETTRQKLVQIFANRQIYKEYRAICIGNAGCRSIEGSIGRDPIHRQKMAVVPEGGKRALTLCETLFYENGLSYVKLLLQTGRTHQIRVHMRHVGCPLLGDPIYGNRVANKKWDVQRQMLHAYRLGFIHPHTNERLEFMAPLPLDFCECARFLEGPSHFDLKDYS